jgi:hypothetical protein
MGARSGKTLTHILKILLNKGEYDFKKLHADEYHGIGYYRWYLRWFQEIYYKLEDENLVQCTIINIEVRR